MFLFLPRSRLLFLSLSSPFTFFFLFFTNSLCFLPVIIATLLWFLFDTILRMLNVHSGKKLFLETFGERLDMHVVAITSSFTSAFNMLFAFCIQKISHRRKLCLYLLAIKKSAIRIFLRVLSVFFFAIFDVDVSDNMIS